MFLRLGRLVLLWLLVVGACTSVAGALRLPGGSGSARDVISLLVRPVLSRLWNVFILILRLIGGVRHFIIIQHVNVLFIDRHGDLGSLLLFELLYLQRCLDLLVFVDIVVLLAAGPLLRLLLGFLHHRRRLVNRAEVREWLRVAQSSLIALAVVLLPGSSCLAVDWLCSGGPV